MWVFICPLLADGVVNSGSCGSYTWTHRTLENLTILDGFHFELSYGEENFDSSALFVRHTELEPHSLISNHNNNSS